MREQVDLVNSCSTSYKHRLPLFASSLAVDCTACVNVATMKLAELLLQRVQLQNDLSDQGRRIQENAQVLEGEQPLEDPELILTG